MNANTQPSRRANAAALIAGFAAIYLIWGSTYIGIRFAVETLPPFLMAGTRFSLAGLILLALTMARGAAWPSRTQWRNAAIVGALLLAGGNGLVCWAEQSVASGVAALMIGTVPLWMTLLNWLVFGEPRPGSLLVAGIAIGFAGVAILGLGEGIAGGQSTAWGIAALLAACVSWTFGSLFSRRADQGPSILAASAMQMIVGGAAMTIIGTLLGEWSRVDVHAITARSALAFAYLLIFGSLVAFSAYVYLLRVVSPAAVSTYAYVNPVVAVALGWWLGDEPITARTLLAGAFIVGAVVLMTMRCGTRATGVEEATTQADSGGLSPGSAIRK